MTSSCSVEEYSRIWEECTDRERTETGVDVDTTTLSLHKKVGVGPICDIKKVRLSFLQLTLKKTTVVSPHTI